MFPAMAASKDGLKLTIEPVKEIYSSREGLMMKFVFTAQSRTKLCLSKDLLSQMQVNIARAGAGKLQLEPLVLQDNTEIFREKMKVHWLEPGQKLILRANLKRYRFAGDEKWAPGEYSVAATFNLCEQTPGDYATAGGRETPVPSAGQGWFLIMS